MFVLIILFLICIFNSNAHPTYNFSNYLVCYPAGGLNDMLFNINRCLMHSVKYQRLLIIDTTKIDWFHHDIRDYIFFNHSNIYIGNLSTIYSTIQELSIYPSEFKLHLTQFAAKYDTATHNFVFNISGNLISAGINLDKSYSEEVIVFASLGGGLPNLILEHMLFKKVVTDVYYERLSKLPLSFIGVHIRNTDRKCDVQEFIKSHDKIFSTNIFFLASDHNETINLFKILYKENVYQFSKIHVSSTGIHYSHSTLYQKDFIIDAMTDILLLSSSTNLYMSTLNSGYSRLAKYIFERKSLLHELTNNSSDLI
jgi:hypothetical protein